MQSRQFPSLAEFSAVARRAILTALLALVAATALATPAFVQVDYSDPQVPVQSLGVNLTQAQTAGNLNVVAVAWNDTTTSVVSVTDTRGNTYRLAGSPTALPGVATQAMYYAENIAAAAPRANTLTVTFDAPAPYVDVRVAEYSGIATTGSLDGAAGHAGRASLTTSGALTTTHADDLLVGANYVAHTTTSAGPGYTARVITYPDRSIVEDRIVSTTGTYTATAPQSRSNWYVMHVVAFRAASGGATTSQPATGTASTAAPAPAPTGTDPVNSTTTATTTTAAPAPRPAVTLSANPASVVSGGTSTLTWNSTNATSCEASGGWSGTKATSGSQATGALTSTTTFIIKCAGSGMIARKAVSVAVTPAGTSRFPLRVEAGKRYLVDAQGKPFLMQGDSAWSLIVELTREQANQYLEDRRNRGFNTVLVELIEHYYSSNPPKNVYGDAPFLVKGDFSTPNDAYFDHAEYVIAKAREKGLLVLLTPAYLGYNGGSQGWYQEMKANGQAKLRTYGQYVASRFQGYDNVLWVQGGDYNPPGLTEVRAVASGIRDIDTARLQTFHGSRGTAALQFLGTGETWLGVNNIYTTQDDVVAEAFGEYARSTMPFFLLEARYEGESGGTERVIRQQAYQAVLSGAFGHVMGNRPIWLFDPGWQTALGSPGSSTVGYLRTLLEPRAWWTLIPDTQSTLVTAGKNPGTSSQAAAALASDRSFAVITLPTIRDITVDLAKLAGPKVVARWYDPTNGTFRSIAGSPFGSSARQVFRPTGNNSRNNSDWVLLLESAP